MTTIATSWTAADYTALEQAIKSGVLRVQYSDGKTIEYRSLEEMMTLLEVMGRKISGKPSSPRMHFAETRKGPRPGFYPGAGRNRTGFEQ